MYRLRGCIGPRAACQLLPAAAECTAALAHGRRMMAAGPAQHDTGSQGDPAAGSEPQPDPPGAFASALALGSGAVGAVAVAAVGVFGVFQMALYVAEHSGRSMTPKPPALEPQVVVVRPDLSAPAQEHQRR